MLSFFYSFLHFWVDGVCALAMYSCFVHGRDGHLAILFYNFCAFPLQMLFGAFLDVWVVRLRQKREEKWEQKQGQNHGQKWGLLTVEKASFFVVLSGGVVTTVGAFTSPVVLGIGNALFHIGGGVGTIWEDNARGWKGKALGVFVAPGALGLYLGTVLGKAGEGSLPLPWLFLAVGAMALLLAGGWHQAAKADLLESGKVDRDEAGMATGSAFGKPSFFADVLFITACFGVVVLRSMVGFEVGFGWKNTTLLGLLAVLCVVFGKVLGGFAAAKHGARVATLVSLLGAALCYGFSDQMVPGLLALLLFNMTMPITLYLLVERYPAIPGTMFGLLTAALFLGFLPTYFGIALPLTGKALGVAGSLASLVILLGAFLLLRSSTREQ